MDSHFGHSSPTPNGFHSTKYTNAGQSRVKVEGADAVVIGGSTGCGDPAVGGSSRVKIGGIGVHRELDATGGHGSWVANMANSGSSRVRAG